MDAYTPKILAQGVLGMMGKGKRSAQVVQAIRDSGAVYLATIGGAGAFLSGCIKKCRVAAFEDLGPEALYELEVEDFPAIVINDPQGGDYYRTVGSA
jgi:fumarate hydratase subunit beta